MGQHRGWLQGGAAVGESPAVGAPAFRREGRCRSVLCSSTIIPVVSLVSGVHTSGVGFSAVAVQVNERAFFWARR
eukprot:1183754-Prorocentrum_minimum.AAC.2